MTEVRVAKPTTCHRKPVRPPRVAALRAKANVDCQSTGFSRKLCAGFSPHALGTVR